MRLVDSPWGRSLTDGICSVGFIFLIYGLGCWLWNGLNAYLGHIYSFVGAWVCTVGFILMLVSFVVVFAYEEISGWLHSLPAAVIRSWWRFNNRVYRELEIAEMTLNMKRRVGSERRN